MERGLAIMEVNDAETKAIFIDQDAVEFARMNLRIKKRVARAEQAQKIAEDNRRKAEKAADDNRRKAEKAEENRRAYNMATVKYLLPRFAIIGIMAWGLVAGLIHPFVSIPLILICLCTASARIGAWRGHSRKKEAK